MIHEQNKMINFNDFISQTAAFKGLLSRGKKRKEKRETFEIAVKSWRQRKNSHKKPRFLPNSPLKNGNIN